MSTDANRQLARCGYAMFMKGDIEGVIGLCAEDIARVSPKTNRFPFQAAFTARPR